MVVPDGGSCHGLRVKLLFWHIYTATNCMCLCCNVSAHQTAANLQFRNGRILKGVNTAAQ